MGVSGVVYRKITKKKGSDFEFELVGMKVGSEWSNTAI